MTDHEASSSIPFAAVRKESKVDRLASTARARLDLTLSISPRPLAAQARHSAGRLVDHRRQVVVLEVDRDRADTLQLSSS